MRFQAATWIAVLAALLLGGGQARAQQVELASNYDEAEGPAQGAPIIDQQSAYANGAPECGNCGQCEQCCPREPRCCLPLLANHCPRFGTYLFSGFDSWRGVSEAGGPNNNGIVSGLNMGLPIPVLDEFGIGAQGGFSAGYYDLMGRPTNGANEANQVQQQYMVTYGFFRRADEGRPLSGGVVQDWMINNNFGATSNEFTASQWRAQAAYALSGCNEIGVWGTWRDRGGSQTVVPPGVAPVAVQQAYRAISQANFFWHHKWGCGGADSWLYLGFPAYGRFNQAAGAGASIGEMIFGGAFNAPVSDHMALYANAMYMKPSAKPGTVGSTEEFFNLSVGLAFYPGATARSSSIAGRSWMPVMPLANNGNFLIDRNF